MKERETALGVFLVIRVKQAPRLRNLIIEGTDELSNDDVIKAIDKRNGDIISPFDQYEIARRIKDAYREDGLLFAKVETELVKLDSANAYDLLVEIDEGRQIPLPVTIKRP